MEFNDVKPTPSVVYHFPDNQICLSFTDDDMAEEFEKWWWGHGIHDFLNYKEEE